MVYTLWGYYVATGQYEPVVRIMQALRWSKNKNDGNFSLKKIFSNWRNDPSAVDKISTGATAKWTLASYAERNRDLLSLYRAEYEHQPKEIAQPLARRDRVPPRLFESEKIRKDQFGAIEDAQKLQGDKRSRHVEGRHRRLHRHRHRLRGGERARTNLYCRALRHRRRAVHRRHEAHALGLGGAPRRKEGVPHEDAIRGSGLL